MRRQYNDSSITLAPSQSAVGHCLRLILSHNIFVGYCCAVPCGNGLPVVCYFSCCCSVTGPDRYKPHCATGIIVDFTTAEYNQLSKVECKVDDISLKISLKHFKKHFSKNIDMY